MDTKQFCQDGSRFLFSSGISAAASVSISQCLTNQALSNKTDVEKKCDVKLVGGRGGLGERGRTATRGNHGSERLEWEMKIFAEFLRLT